MALVYRLPECGLGSERLGLRSGQQVASMCEPLHENHKNCCVHKQFCSLVKK